MSKNEQPDRNTGKKWSELELFDLRNAVERGYKVPEIATFLMRTEAEEKSGCTQAKASDYPVTTEPSAAGSLNRARPPASCVGASRSLLIDASEDGPFDSLIMAQIAVDDLTQKLRAAENIAIVRKLIAAKGRRRRRG